MRSIGRQRHHRWAVLMGALLLSGFLQTEPLAEATPNFVEQKDGVTIVHLTQTPCTIVEVEKTPQRFQSQSAEDCKRINKETADQREFRELVLPAGKTIFRVTNKNVPYELGFWVRGRGVSRLTLPTVSGGGLTQGKTQDYVVNLEPGQYWYSCPLNPTPNYPLVVR